MAEIRFQTGGAEGDRTPDLRIANATLSQLSYGPELREIAIIGSESDTSKAIAQIT